ncbi:MAG: hypothetical protein IPN92_17180 [Chromatiaceae bacterium]|nr:hypothetical protein [Chromatiaceae bacterium]
MTRSFRSLSTALLFGAVCALPISANALTSMSGEWEKDVDVTGATQDDYRKVLGSDLAKKIVIYCGFTKCGRSHNAATWAKKLGYTNVYRAPDGITAWKDLGYPYLVVPNKGNVYPNK